MITITPEMLLLRLSSVKTYPPIDDIDPTICVVVRFDDIGGFHNGWKLLFDLSEMPIPPNTILARMGAERCARYLNDFQAYVETFK